jgi:hypothetical protein
MRAIAFLSLFLCAFALNAQDDTSAITLPHAVPADTALAEALDSNAARPTQRNPKRAALMSLTVPGLGQIYNKRYWKLPIVYGALGTAGFFVIRNRILFEEFKDAYVRDFNTLDGDVSGLSDLGYTLPALKEEAEFYQTNMEYAGVAFIAIYLLQVVDAAVDAHLYYFDVSEDLSFNWQPTIQYTATQRPINGLSLALTF